jgi:hypothetical protein
VEDVVLTHQADAYDIPNAEAPEKTIAKIRVCRSSGGLEKRNTLVLFHLDCIHTHKFFKRFSTDQSSNKRLGIKSSGMDSKLL